MDRQKDLPKRKHARLNRYDYSTSAAYYVTICTHNRKDILSRIVGRGLAPAVTVEAELTQWGKIAEDQLLSLEKRYPFVTIDKYAIMPDHIHVILLFNDQAAGASPRPTLMDVICAFKSLTTGECKRNGLLQERLFQTSFHEHIIRGREDYKEIADYIQKNPIRRYYGSDAKKQQHD